MSKNKVGNARPKRQTKSERLADLCHELMNHVKKVGESQVKLYDVVLKTEAQVNVLSAAMAVLKEKGLITDDDVKAQIEKDKIEIQNAKSNEGASDTEGVDSGSEESGSESEVHTDDSTEESEVSAAESERTVDDDAS